MRGDHVGLPLRNGGGGGGGSGKGGTDCITVLHPRGQGQPTNRRLLRHTRHVATIVVDARVRVDSTCIERACKSCMQSSIDMASLGARNAFNSRAWTLIDLRRHFAAFERRTDRQN